jgi:hypothetical protein
MIVFVTAAAARDADGLVDADAFAAAVPAVQEILKTGTSQGHVMKKLFPYWAGKLPDHVIKKDLGRHDDEDRNDVAGWGQIDFLYTVHQINEYYRGTKLPSRSALFDVVNVDVFKGVNLVDRGDNVTIARLHVKALGALLHLCAVDTAAMTDINAVALQDMYDELRGL